jgi:bacillithiol system protein YtxJ
VTEILRPIRSEEDLEQLATEPLAVLYKHSPWCGMSAGAQVEVQQFATSHPEVPVYMVDVVGHRALSRLAAERFGVQHESPQVLVVAQGGVVWDASHARVSCARIERALADRGARAPDG